MQLAKFDCGCVGFVDDSYAVICARDTLPKVGELILVQECLKDAAVLTFWMPEPSSILQDYRSKSVVLTTDPVEMRDWAHKVRSAVVDGLMMRDVRGMLAPRGGGGQ